MKRRRIEKERRLNGKQKQGREEGVQTNTCYVTTKWKGRGEKGRKKERKGERRGKVGKKVEP